MTALDPYVTLLNEIILQEEGFNMVSHYEKAIDQVLRLINIKCPCHFTEAEFRERLMTELTKYNDGIEINPPTDDCVFSVTSLRGETFISTLDFDTVLEPVVKRASALNCMGPAQAKLMANAVYIALKMDIPLDIVKNQRRWFERTSLAYLRLGLERAKLFIVQKRKVATGEYFV